MDDGYRVVVDGDQLSFALKDAEQYKGKIHNLIRFDGEWFFEPETANNWVKRTAGKTGRVFRSKTLDSVCHFFFDKDLDPPEDIAGLTSRQRNNREHFKVASDRESVWVVRIQADEATDEPNKLDQLVRNTPELDVECNDWIRVDDVRMKKEAISRPSLKELRYRGVVVQREVECSVVLVNP